MTSLPFIAAYFHRAKEIGTHCLTVVAHLFNDKVLDNLRTVQGILRLKDKYGKIRLEAACYRAICFETINYHSVKVILSKILENETFSEEQVFDSLADSYTGGGKHHRDPKTIM